MVELKSKSSKSRIDWAAYYFQMLLSGSAKLALGVHSAGTFRDIRLYLLDEVRAQCAAHIDHNLSKLTSLLLRLLTIARNRGLQQFSLFCVENSLMRRVWRE